MSDQTCDCCGDRLSFIWSDTHGVGCCWKCGLPYTIYHYEGPEGQQKRVDKPPAVALTPEGLEIAKRYWAEKQRRVYPAAFDMGILHGRESSYSGATPDDCREFNDWYKANIPARAQDNGPEQR